MAAPKEKTIKDLSGKWVMNKTLSDDIDGILQMQNIGWFLRRAISLATITLSITQYTTDVKDDSSTSSPTPETSTDPSPPSPPSPTATTETEKVTHIDITQTATGGIKGTTERRTLDWKLRGHKDGIFGEVKGKSRWASVKDLEGSDGWLKGPFLDEDGGVRVQAWVESVGGGWTAEQVWGFEEIKGARHHVRHVIVRKGEDWKQARLVYDYQGST